jgi:hypothetical protein
MRRPMVDAAVSDHERLCGGVSRCVCVGEGGTHVMIAITAISLG